MGDSTEGTAHFPYEKDYYSTAVMMTTVAGNVNAIGYVSLGSLSDSVKALAIDGVAATVENIENGSYAISRPFNIATLATAVFGHQGDDFTRPKVHCRHSGFHRSIIPPFPQGNRRFFPYVLL